MATSRSNPSDNRTQKKKGSTWRSVRMPQHASVAHTLQQRYSLRWHGLLIGSFTLLLMWCTSHVQMLLGVESLALRYFITLSVGYLGYLLVLRAWAARLVRQPRRLRLTATVHQMEEVGLDAVPLIALLSYLVGAVIAFLGSTILRDFGAEIYVVELVGIAFLREFAVLLTAIVLAGRTASAFTAQIGAMKSREEIDAIRTLGLDPVDLLVIPRLLALLVMLPLLTFIAMMAGLAGGVTVGAFDLDIPPQMYLSRMHETVEVRHFLVGMSKAPVFALVIGLIGCLEGLRVEGTAQSVGERTTSSVVQTISLVIILDAMAALWFMHMDL